MRLLGSFLKGEGTVVFMSSSFLPYTGPHSGQLHSWRGRSEKPKVPGSLTNREPPIMALTCLPPKFLFLREKYR